MYNEFLDYIYCPKYPKFSRGKNLHYCSMVPWSLRRGKPDSLPNMNCPSSLPSTFESNGLLMFRTSKNADFCPVLKQGKRNVKERRHSSDSTGTDCSDFLKQDTNRYGNCGGGLFWPKSRSGSKWVGSSNLTMVVILVH